MLDWVSYRASCRLTIMLPIRFGQVSGGPPAAGRTHSLEDNKASDDFNALRQRPADA